MMWQKRISQVRIRHGATKNHELKYMKVESSEIETAEDDGKSKPDVLRVRAKQQTEQLTQNMLYFKMLSLEIRRRNSYLHFFNHCDINVTEKHVKCGPLGLWYLPLRGSCLIIL